MSYELHLIRKGAQGRWNHPAEAELNPGPAVETKEEEKRRLADALIRFNAAFRVAQFDYAALAASQNIDEREARRRYRHIELDCDDYSGIQITLWDDSAEVTFPYWHSGEQARTVLQQVWESLEVLETWGTFVTFDPQLDRVLNLTTDFEPVLEYLEAGINSTYESAPHEL